MVFVSHCGFNYLIVIVLQPVSLNIKTPPRSTQSDKHSLIVFDDFDKLLDLLRKTLFSLSEGYCMTWADYTEVTARISGLLALVLPKVHLLDVSRKLCDQQFGIQSNG